MRLNRARGLVCTLLTAGLLVAGGCQSGVDAHSGASRRPTRSPVPVADLTLEVTGPGVGRPTTFTYAALANMEMVSLDDVLMRKSTEPDERTSWRGPALEALLSAAEAKPGPQMIVLEARDGYRMRCTRDELRSAIVALQDGRGRWLAEVDPACPLRLVPPRLPGNYWVMNLRRITVEPLASP